jgi:hypothetical protein
LSVKTSPPIAMGGLALDVVFVSLRARVRNINGL